MGITPVESKITLGSGKFSSVVFVSVVSKQQRNISLLPVTTSYSCGYGKERQALGLTPLLERDQSTLSNNCGVKRLEASRSGNEALCARSAQLCPLLLILCRDKPAASTEHPGRELMARTSRKLIIQFNSPQLISSFSSLNSFPS